MKMQNTAMEFIRFDSSDVLTTSVTGGGTYVLSYG